MLLEPDTNRAGKCSRQYEKKLKILKAESDNRGESLENRVTNMLHEIGIPAHIKGYHYLRDAIMMAVDDMDVLNAITKDPVSDGCEEVSDNIQQGGTCDPTCD